jgi:hypothetical protein
MEYLVYAGLALASHLAALGGGAYLHYRYGKQVRRMAEIVGAAVEQAKSK